MKFKYYPDSNGGFIGSEDGQTQVCDFREGMGERYGEQIAAALSGCTITISAGTDADPGLLEGIPESEIITMPFVPRP